MKGYAAVIIAYRRPDLIREVLARLDAQTLRPVLTVVVDNGGDLVPEDLLEVGGAVPVLISQPSNPGYAAAVNLAVEQAKRSDVDRLLVLTHDAVFDPALGSSLCEVLSANDRAGAVAPTLRWVSQPDRVFSAGGMLTRGGRAYHRLDPVGAHPRAVTWVDGAAVMYRVTALDDIGGIDERYFLYFEDVDTGWALSRSGWRTLVTSDIARQEPGAHPVRLGLRNMILFVRKAELPRSSAIRAVLRRAVEELVVGVVRDHRLLVLDAWRGVRDGLAGRTGKP